MKTSLALLASAVLMMTAAVPSYAADDDWASQSPIAAGEPMHDCAPQAETAAIAGEPAPDLVKPVLPVSAPAEPLPPADSKAQLVPPKAFPVATLFTFALMASPGSSLPQK